MAAKYYPPIITSSSGDNSPFGGTIWVAGASNSSSAYASGLTYTPLRHGFDDYVRFQALSARNGTISLMIKFAMSGGQAANLYLRIDKLIISNGSSASTGITTGTSFIKSLNNDILVHESTSSDSSDLTFNVTSNDIVFIIINRLGSDLVLDTHSSDLRIIDLRAT